MKYVQINPYKTYTKNVAPYHWNELHILKGFFVVYFTINNKKLRLDIVVCNKYKIYSNTLDSTEE